jgi:TDG/mug DNA glycosylase family protein
VVGRRSEDPHDRTIRVYEERGDEWEARRRPRTDEAADFTDRLGREDGPEGAVVDLGCGPGWHLPELPPGTIAADAARRMLDLVPGHTVGAPRVQLDLRALPFARHSLRAAWVNKSYVHLDRRVVPMALWDLHRSVAVGGVVHLGVFGAGDAEQGGVAATDHDEWAADDFAGRSFSHWDPALLRAVVAGAGFETLDATERPESDGVTFHRLVLRRSRTLADTVGPGMRLLVVGLNPSLYAADTGVGFARPGNRAWPALLASRLARVDRDPFDLLRRGRVGMTDLVKRATARADELRPHEYADGLDRLDRLCAWLRPGAVCVLGITGWRHATGERRAALGPQTRTLGGRPVHVAPNPSGLNAHTDVADLVDHLQAAVAMAARA